LDGFYGDDGLGNSTKELPDIPFLIESEHAVSALSRLVKQFPKQITIMAFGPLTNLALTHLIDPEFFNNLKEIVVMGGTINALGNSGPTYEFNFFNDPEAVHVVLNNSEFPITIIPWETSLKHLIPWVLLLLLLLPMMNHRITLIFKITLGHLSQNRKN